MITITDWVAVIPPEDKLIAYVGEHATVTRQFFLPDLLFRDYTFYLDLAFDLTTVTSQTTPKEIVSTQQTTSEVVAADGVSLTATDNINRESYTQTQIVVDCDAKTDITSLAKLVKDDGVYLTWTVLAQHTQLPGRLRATLRAVNTNGDVKKSAVMTFTVATSVKATPAAPILLTEYEQMEQSMALALKQAAEATYTAFDEKFVLALGSLEETKVYIDQKTAPATGGSYGTVKVWTDLDTAQIDGGIFMNSAGHLQVVAATEDSIDMREPTAPITPQNLDYAVKAVTYDRGEIDQKTAPATGGSYGTVKAWTDLDDAQIGGGIVMDDEGRLKIVSAPEILIDWRSGAAPITPFNLDYAVKSVGDGYYALASDVGDIETALDGIIALQAALIGGDA